MLKGYYHFQVKPPNGFLLYIHIGYSYKLRECHFEPRNGPCKQTIYLPELSKYGNESLIKINKANNFICF